MPIIAHMKKFRIGNLVLALVVSAGGTMGLSCQKAKTSPELAHEQIAATQLAWESISNAIELYGNDMGLYPHSLVVLVVNEGYAEWKGPYLSDKNALLDAWGNPFNYARVGMGFSLSSSGPDEEAGTADDIR